MKDLLTEYITLHQEATHEQVRREKVSNHLVRQVAQNKSTPPKLLRKLAISSDRVTRQYVTANPNTPLEVLLLLGGQFPQQLLDNSRFLASWLEHSSLINKIPINTLIALLKLEKLPMYVIKQASHSLNADVQLAVAMNPQTPREVLEKLVRSEDAKVVEAAQMHVNWAGEICLNRKQTAEFLLLYPQIPNEILVEYSSSVSWLERYAIAIHPNTPLDTLHRLAGDGNRVVRAVAKTNLQSRHQQL